MYSVVFILLCAQPMSYSLFRQRLNGTGKDGLLYIMLNTLHCSLFGNKTRNLMDGFSHSAPSLVNLRGNLQYSLWEIPVLFNSAIHKAVGHSMTSTGTIPVEQKNLHWL